MAVKTKGKLKLNEQLNTLKLPAKKRYWLHKGMGRKVRTKTRARIRQQKDLNGVPWKGRADGTNRKMMRGLSKKLVIFASTDTAKITWRNWKTASIAKAQHEGIDEQFSAAKAKKAYGKPDYKSPATRKQAKALREAGYTIPRGRGKSRKTPSLKWMTENMRMGQAGFILRMLRKKKKKQNWTLELPERSFLGATDRDSSEMLNYVSDQLTKFK